MGLLIDYNLYVDRLLHIAAKARFESLRRLWYPTEGAPYIKSDEMIQSDRQVCNAMLALLAEHLDSNSKADARQRCDDLLIKQGLIIKFCGRIVPVDEQVEGYVASLNTKHQDGVMLL